MVKTPNQKMKILYLMKILLEQSDEEHPIGMASFIEQLAEKGIKAERKSIYSDLKLLKEFGLDLILNHDKNFGYFIGKRDFELPELKLLVDAVQSSNIITRGKTETLIQKLSALTSMHRAKQLNRQVYVIDRPKPLNENIYYSIDAIHSAINEKRKIHFKYFDYDLNKRRVYRRKSEDYCQTPVALCWNEDNYYLICYSSKYDDLAHYRVDRMCDVGVCEEEADVFDKKRFNLSEHVKETFGMFSGDRFPATFRFNEDLVNVVLDHFGKSTVFTRVEGGFEITVNVSESPVLLGWLFQFGRKAEIIAPERLKLAMKQAIREASQLYPQS